MTCKDILVAKLFDFHLFIKCSLGNYVLFHIYQWFSKKNIFQFATLFFCWIFGFGCGRRVGPFHGAGFFQLPLGAWGGQFVQFVFWSKIVKLHVCNVCYTRYYVSFYLWWMVTVFGQRSMFYLKKTTNKSWKLFNDTFLVLKYNSASYKKTFVYTDNHEQSISSKVAKSSKIRQE